MVYKTVWNRTYLIACQLLPHSLLLMWSVGQRVVGDHKQRGLLFWLAGYLNQTDFLPLPTIEHSLIKMEVQAQRGMIGLRPKCFGVLLLLLLGLLMCSNFDGCEARKGTHWRQKRSPSSSLVRKKSKGKNGGSHSHTGGHLSPPPSSNTSPSPGTDYPAPPAAATFDVIDFGANGDGVTDDTKVAVPPRIVFS